MSKEYKDGNVSRAEYVQRLTELEQRSKTLNAQYRQHTREIQANIKYENTQRNTIEGLTAEIEKLTLAYRKMDLESDTAIETKQKIHDLQKRLNEANAELLNFHGQVGNYATAAKGFDHLNYQVQLIARELPSLTVSVQQFFLALSNNLPMLGDELQRARMQNKALAAEGKQTIPIIKQVITAAFSWQTALVIGITLLTTYGKEIGNWIKGLFGAASAAEKAARALQTLTSQVISQREALRREFYALRQAEEGTAQYAAARKVIEDKYGSYLQNQSDEIKNLQDLDAAYKVLEQSITAAAIAKGLETQRAEFAEDFSKGVDKALKKSVRELFDNQFADEGENAGAQYMARFVEGFTSGNKELQAEAEKIYQQFADASKIATFDQSGNPTIQDINPLENLRAKLIDLGREFRDSNAYLDAWSDSLLKTYDITPDIIDGLDEETAASLKQTAAVQEQTSAWEKLFDLQAAAWDDEMMTRQRQYEKERAEVLAMMSETTRQSAHEQEGLKRLLEQIDADYARDSAEIYKKQLDEREKYITAAQERIVRLQSKNAPTQATETAALALQYSIDITQEEQRYRQQVEETNKRIAAGQERLAQLEARRRNGEDVAAAMAQERDAVAANQAYITDITQQFNDYRLASEEAFQQGKQRIAAKYAKSDLDALAAHMREQGNVGREFYDEMLRAAIDNVAKMKQLYGEDSKAYIEAVKLKNYWNGQLTQYRYDEANKQYNADIAVKALEVQLAQEHLAELERLNQQGTIAYQNALRERENATRKYAEAVSRYETQLAADRFGAMSDFVGGVADLTQTLAGENEEYAAFSKAMTIFQITLQTAAAIASAVASATPGDPYTLALRIAAAVVSATASMAAALSTAKSAEMPSYAEGGLVTGAGTGTSDSITARVSNGEAVMTARAVDTWGDVLSAMNVASGGRAITTPNNMASRRLLDSLDAGRAIDDVLQRYSEQTVVAFEAAVTKMRFSVAVDEFRAVENRVNTIEHASKSK